MRSSCLECSIWSNLQHASEGLYGTGNSWGGRSTQKLFNCPSTWYKERLAQRSELGAAKPCSLHSDNFYTQASLAQTFHYLMVVG